MAITVSQAIIELQKLQMGGNGECELLQKYDGMVLETEGFAVRHITVHPRHGSKDWVPKDTNIETLPDKDTVAKVVRIISGQRHNNW
jgi:hypothetical protein